jgi:threonylcarbamoyladenosine tRNA methylthiotransferase MtaB
MPTKATIAFHTLGCKLNFAESSSIRRQVEEDGYTVSKFNEFADVYVINTCSVTDFADKKCRKAVRSALKNNPDADVVLMGCYAQLKPEDLSKMPGVSMVLGATEKFNLLVNLNKLNKGIDQQPIQVKPIVETEKFNASFSFGDRTRSFLKIQDGCDYVCTYCTIPEARGVSRSDSISGVVNRAKQIAESGIREIVLTGVNIGDFRGKEADEKQDFYQLIQALDEVEGIDRFRISSIEPNLCTNEIIQFVAKSKRFMPHFHIPLQSGNDKQLATMKRRYKRAMYADRVSVIKDLMPHASIGVDVICGFPGETENDFKETYRFIKDLPVSYLHVFSFSARPGTEAFDMTDQVAPSVIRERSELLRILSERKQSIFYRSHIGTVRQVLLEKGKNDGFLQGFTDNYIRAEVQEENLFVNQIVPLNLNNQTEDGLMNAEIET